MSAFFGFDEINSQGFLDKSVVCIPHGDDGELDLHAVVSPIRKQDIVFIKHVTSEPSMHIKAVGVVQSDYPTEPNLGICLPVKWVWQGEKVAVNFDEVVNLSNERFYEEHNIVVQREVIDLMPHDMVETSRMGKYQ